MSVRFCLICAAVLMNSACQTTKPPKLPASYDAKLGQSVAVYDITQPALQIGDNEGRISDIEAIPNRFYAGYSYEFPPITFDESPASATLYVSANSVSASCDSLVLINRKKIGKLNNGKNNFDLDRSFVHTGKNVLAVAADGCHGSSGHDDILIREVTLTAK